MSRLGTVLLIAIGLILAGLSTPAAAELSCSAANAVFYEAASDYAKGAPASPESVDSAAAEERLRDLSQAIALQRDRIGEIETMFGKASAEAGGARIALAQLLRRAGQFKPALAQLDVPIRFCSPSTREAWPWRKCCGNAASPFPTCACARLRKPPLRPRSRSMHKAPLGTPHWRR